MSNLNANKHYSQFVALSGKIADIQYAGAVLNWDQETYMPLKGAAGRARQLATLSGIAHELSISSEMETLLNELASDLSLDEVAKANVTVALRDFNKHKKYPVEFVMRMSTTVSGAFAAWEKARNENDWKGYIPALEAMVQIKREEAALIGSSVHPLDNLMDDFEPGLTCADLDILFDQVRKELSPLLEKIRNRPQVSNSCLERAYNKDLQWKFGLDLLKNMGYDFEAGRQDVSTHPFTTNFNAQDVRVTTRLDENDLANLVWSCIHEGGHALYEQGLPMDQYGLPCGSAASLGIHESQSRLWENNVGRSLAYWKYHFPLLQQQFPDVLKDTSLQNFYHAMNRVEPSLIRTEADELTYHFHIMIRFEMEKALLSGELEVKDAREAWNEKYMKYLGVEVPDDKRGILQDVHWSHGGFGYFPTYSLGSFYAAQFFHQAEKDITDLRGEIAMGNNLELLNWLRTHIHQYGRRYKPAELCKTITGETLDVKYFREYAEKKYGDIYGF